MNCYLVFREDGARQQTVGMFAAGSAGEASAKAKGGEPATGSWRYWSVPSACLHEDHVDWLMEGAIH